MSAPPRPHPAVPEAEAPAAPPPPRPAPVRSEPTRSEPVRTLDALDLVGSGGLVHIALHDRLYTLRLTRAGKLILTR